ncbi:MAG: YCF48-related protein [candidate division WOR-3 bacterium]
MKKGIFLILVISFLFARWERLVSPVSRHLYSIHFPNDTLFGIAVGDSGTIIRTTNSGNSWQVLNSNTIQQLRDIWMVNDTGYVCGAMGTILKTTNRGLIWSSIGGFSFQTFYTICFPENSQVGYVFGANGEAYKTTNGGTNWERMSLGTSNNIYACHFVNNNVGFIVGQNGIILRTENGGGIWEIVPTPTTEDLRSVWFVNEEIGYACGNNGVILKTIRSGREWINMSLSNPTILFGINFPNSADTGYICGRNGLFGRTFDGRVWQTYTIKDTDLFAIHFPTNRVGFAVGRGGMILKTSDYGSEAIFEYNNNKIKASFEKSNYLIFTPLGEKVNKINKKGIYFLKEKNYKKIVIF